MNQLTVSLWGDEAFASILAQKSIPDIVTIVARDTSPPLHYILLHFWMNLFGTSEVAIRSLPLLLFVLLAFVVHKFAEDLFGRKASIWAFFLTLLNPFLFIYAFEARMYMLLALTSTLSMWFYVTKRWRWYIPATVAALYTHHFSMFVIIVQVVHYVWSNLDDIRTQLRNPLHFVKTQWQSSFVRSLILTVLLYLPWLPALYGQTRLVQGDFWLPRPKLFDLWLLFTHFTAGFSKVPFVTFILFAIFALFFLRGYHKRKDGILYLWLILPAVLTYVLSQIGRPLFFDRYLIISAPAIPMLLSSQTKKISTMLLTLVTIGLVFANIYSFQRPVKQPFRDVAAFIHQTYGKDKMVINYYTDALHYFELKHYGVNVKAYSPNGPLPFWVGTALIDPRDILTNLPKDKTLFVMAGGQVGRVGIPGYDMIRQERFGNLYLFWFLKR